MKKLISIILVLVMMSNALITVQASAKDSNSNTKIQAPSITSHGENLIILDVPELMEETKTIQQEIINNAAARGLFITLSNRTLRGDYYYANDHFYADVIQGPMATGPNVEFGTSATAGASLDFGIGKNDITASFGVNFEFSQTITRRYQFDPIPNGKSLSIKAYVNYSVCDFDVLQLGIKIGTSNYWVPKGIIINHYLF